MGQIIARFQELETQIASRHGNCRHSRELLPRTFPDLSQLPPELGLLVLSNLNATDLCLAACVWQNLAAIEILWQSLCRSQWPHVSAYQRRYEDGFSFKRLYMQLDEATLTFNADPALGLEYLLRENLVDDTAEEIAQFLHTARDIDWKQMREFLVHRRDVLDRLVELQNFRNHFLPNALRCFFRETHPPNERSDYLSTLVEKFSQRFCECNPQLGLSQDAVYILCYSLIMLSVDLTSPHIKNKMSKREFIRNTRQATAGISDDFVGHLYDNVYLIGHVAPKA
ncbi:F-box only protein 8 [Lamellibrachia satsuma]|nr:F-box only protein 8 [Lamellibrachia satsuma]